MATSNQLLASLARQSLSSATRPSAAPIPRFLLPLASPACQSRFASQRAGGLAKKIEKKKKLYKSFRSYDLEGQEQFSLCDAIRYVFYVEIQLATPSL